MKYRLKQLSVKSIKVYQNTLSPLLPSSCRFYPSCSEYAAQAIENHGFWRGLFKAARRLFKCHPWHPGGFDPID